MPRVRLAFVLALIFALPVCATPAFVQGATTTGGGGLATLNTAYGSNNTAHDLLICLVRFSTGGTLSSLAVTDTQLNTWTALGTIFHPGDYFQVFYVLDAKAGANTVTVTGVGTTGFIRMGIGEWSGGGFGLGVVGQWEYQNNALQIAAGINAFQTNQLVLGFASQVSASANPTAVGGGFTTRVLNSGTGDITILDYVGGSVTTTGPMSLTYGASDNVATVQVSFTSTGSATSAVWQRTGLTFTPNSADYNTGVFPNQTGAANVLYEGSPQVLSATNVFKLWFNSGNDVGYAESTDGRNWTRKVGTVITGAPYLRITKNGATYYASGPSSNYQAINIYSSSDGVTWSSFQANAIGAPDAGYLNYTHGLIWIESGTWYMLYDQYNTGIINYQIAYATSSDGHTWTKQTTLLGGLGFSGTTAFNPSGPYIQKIGSTYYMWAESWIRNGPIMAGNSDIYRWHASAITGPYTLDTASLQRGEPDEGTDTIGNIGGTTDMAMVEVSGTTYAYYTASTAQSAPVGTNFILKGATYAGTIASLVATNEGTITDSITAPTSATAKFVQSANLAPGSASGPNSPTLAFGSNNTAHNFLILVARTTDNSGDNAITGVVDTAGNTWKYGLKAFGQPVGKDNWFVFYVPDCIGGANTVHITSSDGTPIFWNYIIAEYTSIGTNPVLLSATYATGNSSYSGTAGAVGNIHPQSINHLLLGTFSNSTTNSLTFTPGSGWTNRANANGNLVLLDGIGGTSPAAYQVTSGFSSSIAWQGMAMEFGPVPAVTAGARHSVIF